MKNLKSVAFIVLVTLVFGAVYWSRLGRGAHDWANQWEVWYRHGSVRDAELVDGYRIVFTTGGWTYSEKRVVRCRVTEEFYQAAAKAFYNWSLNLPTDRCTEIKP